ncbi:DUF3499 domain-containing protein [Citricoccus alkalitolerans]|uniref:DUF3499 domain-containing protein n=1 Tax=Citricoccus alkalitolerans TaxID=246603 RepID=A0ABV8Y0Y0_9MICC
MRQCSKTSCQSAALATLTYNYADSTVVLGPMSRLAEPHTYDLCEKHARSMTAPKGWELLRIQPPEGADRSVPEEPDDLLALAHAVREPSARSESARPDLSSPPSVGRRGTSPDAGARSESTGSVNGDAPARPGRPTLRLLSEVRDS